MAHARGCAGRGGQPASPDRAARGFGGWRLPVLLCWLAAGAALPSPAAERLALLVAGGFRRPSAAQAAALSAPMAAALRRTGTAAGDIELYVQRRAEPNAYAAGSRGVAVTTGALNHLLAHRLTEDQMVAVLVHELGHHASRAPRAALVTAWLAAPWRLATRLVLRLAGGLAGRQPRRLPPLVGCAGVVLAVVQAVVSGTGRSRACSAASRSFRALPAERCRARPHRRAIRRPVRRRPRARRAAGRRPARPPRGAPPHPRLVAPARQAPTPRPEDRGPSGRR